LWLDDGSRTRDRWQEQMGQIVFRFRKIDFEMEMLVPSLVRSRGTSRGNVFFQVKDHHIMPIEWLYIVYEAVMRPVSPDHHMELIDAHCHTMRPDEIANSLLYLDEDVFRGRPLINRIVPGLKRLVMEDEAAPRKGFDKDSQFNSMKEWTTNAVYLGHLGKRERVEITDNVSEIFCSSRIHEHVTSLVKKCLEKTGFLKEYRVENAGNS